MPHSHAPEYLLIVAWGLLALFPATAQQYLVKDGQPQAEIVTTAEPVPSVKLAASELQTYIRKISGATLPITTDDAAQSLPVRIYVGQSAATDKLGITADGLKWGAYRVQSDKNHLVLIGSDTVFEPRGIYTLNRNEWNNETEAKWHQAAGIDWDNPVARNMQRSYDPQLNLSRFDEKGTLNAVYGFLRSLGVRWFMPGELGEFVPSQQTIALPAVSKTVKPDYPIRQVAFGRYPARKDNIDELYWVLRLGVNSPYGYGTYHGLANVTRSQTLRDEHPEYFALYNGERQVKERTANACLSSEGLFQENLRYVRFMFDMYDVPIVSVWPDDGFSYMCQCEKCRGKDTPERGRQGVLSDYVWDYVNRIAIEIAKSHPGKRIGAGAYSTYLLPPTKIDKLSDNIVVYIVNSRRRYPQETLNMSDLQEWGRLSGGKVISFMNFGGGANTPRIFANDIKALKDLAMGEDLWPPFFKGGLADPGFNHLNYYIAASFEWDANQDIDQVLEEYYRLYYGPAAKQMAAFVAFYEANQFEMRAIDSAPLIKEALDLFETAKKAVDPDSIHGKRLALFERGLAPRKKWYDLIKAGRQNVPTYTMNHTAADDLKTLTIDGKLDEAYWETLPGTLKELQTGGEVAHPTTFKVGLLDHSIYLGIRCEDVAGEPLNAVDLERDSAAIWAGDLVEVLLESPEHAYYQIAISPTGCVTDLDRGAAGKAAWFTWDAQATIVTHVDKNAGIWTIEARIPFTPSLQDPLHEVIGAAPTEAKPWHFNICRQRVRGQDADSEMSAYSPTGAKGFHEILKFAKLR